MNRIRNCFLNYLLPTIIIWGPIFGCQIVEQQVQPDITDMNTHPFISEVDHDFANVFSMFDGKWAGKLYVYVDTRGQRPVPAPKILEPAIWKSAPYKLHRIFVVRYQFLSRSPYFQQVAIWLDVTDEQGKITSAHNVGINKVQQGRLWAVIQQETETLWYEGSRDDNAIIWQRKGPGAKNIEYTREFVKDDVYTCIGWKYQEDDDLSLSPKTFFYGRYTRQ